MGLAYIKIGLKILFLIIVVSCGTKSVQIEEDFRARFDKAIDYFESKKYARAKDEFDYIIIRDSGSLISNNSQYYLGESLFHLGEYKDAAIALEKYIRFSPDYTKIETSRYRICECAILASNSYEKEQSQTLQALGKLQSFIEDYPESDLIQEAEKSILDLRFKLAKKEYEVGRMYLKLEEYESALIYFRSVLNNYYDTAFSDEARIGIIFTHILNKNHKGAKNYFQTEKERFLSKSKYIEAESLIAETETGLKLSQYIKLYK